MGTKDRRRGKGRGTKDWRRGKGIGTKDRKGKGNAAKKEKILEEMKKKKNRK